MNNLIVSSLFSDTELRDLHHTVDSVISHYPDNHFAQRLKKVVDGDNTSLLDLLLSIKDYLYSSQKELDNQHNNFPLPRSLSSEEGVLCAKAMLNYQVGSNFLTLSTPVVSQKLVDVYEQKQKRKVKKVEMDLALVSRLSDQNYSHYSSAGQRMAVRVALTCPQDSTLFINLPTGCGKTLVAHASMLFSKSKALTIVIVPTVGLAIEQGKRAKELLEKADNFSVQNYAWHSQLSDGDKSEIRDNIDNGQQKVIFTSPESITGSLLPLLFRLAENNYIANIIIDEAHLIDTWGSNFRSEFQRFGALVASLRQVSNSPFKTILMSATFTQSNIDSLTTLYCEPNIAPIIVNGNFLRPEVSSLYEKVDKNSHIQTVTNRVVVLPKPLILYTTLIQDSITFIDELKGIGLNRIALFIGDTPANSKEEIIEQWKNDELDIIVANSAFGVGMDKSNVKSVIHACVPDNIDRYYQEIGRAGRNGEAATSELIYHEKQFSEAKRINKEILISTELGYKKWKGMWSKKVDISSHPTLKGDLYQLDTSFYHDGLDKKSGRNEDWNWLTLLLMQRAGSIRVFYDVPEIEDDNELNDFERNSQRKEYWKGYKSKVLVQIINEQSLSNLYWETNIEKHRKNEINSQDRAYLTLSDNISSLRKPICKELVKYYTLNSFSPQRACGGCIMCDGFLPSLGDSVSVGNYSFSNSLPSSLAEYISFDNVCSVYYDNSNELTSDLQWSKLIKKMLDNKHVCSVKADSTFLNNIQNKLPKSFKSFWISQDITDSSNLWPSLYITSLSDVEVTIPLFEEQITFFIGERSQKTKSSKYRLWWQDNNRSIPLVNFKNLVEKNTCQ
ncbi:protein DpdF [Colwellia sp. MB02u-14]|uniref:protein DpdF n=1 Tax=Colwellia sp. MB02u-14 TaxID=2759815 RepID=UPI0015F4165F|nr:protein DpdF [Colwellia sp. MB02u-14]MBA6304938.1 DEAD/DEAH box helicase [Colwellia sp. MB02u-14]